MIGVLIPTVTIMNKIYSSTNKNLYQLLDRFIPQTIHHSATHQDFIRKYRLLIGFSLFGSLIWLVSTVLLVIIIKEPTPFEVTLVVFVLIMGIFNLALPPILWKTNAYKKIAIIYLLSIKIALLLLIFMSGGIASPNILWLIMGSFLAMIFLGSRFSLISAVIDILSIIGFQLIGSNYVAFIPVQFLSIIRFSVYIMGTTLFAFVALFFESARKRAQFQLETTLEDLQVTNRQLHTAHKEAQAATQAKSEFLANMSHEIRTPLNGIIGVSGLLFETPLNKEQQEYSQIIQTSGDSLLTIINEILDFSKIEAGKLELEEQPFDLRQSIEDALDLLSPKAAGKGLELVYSADIEIPSQFIGDATRFRQILVNLLGNAVKFTEKGEVIVYVHGNVVENGRLRTARRCQRQWHGHPAGADEPAVSIL